MEDHGRPGEIVQSAGVDNSKPDHARGTKEGGWEKKGGFLFGCGRDKQLWLWRREERPPLGR
jgi:hypothetical protein